MIYSLGYVLLLFITLYGKFEWLSLQDSYISMTNTLIAFGIIGICSRLDKIIKELKK